MNAIPLVVLAAIIAGLAAFIWRARPDSPVNRWFGAYTVLMGSWVLGIAGLHGGHNLEIWGRFTFASASLLPATFLAFTRCYPTPSRWPSTFMLRLALGLGALLALLSLTTPLVVHQVSMAAHGLTRKTGLLYPFFTVYFLVGWGAALSLFIVKWRHAAGLPRAQLQHLAIGLLISGIGGISTNLLLPLVTGHSRHSSIGPYFILPLVALVGHAIIRHRLMNIRLVVRRGVIYLLAGAIAGFLFLAVIGAAAALADLEIHDVPLALQVALTLAIALSFAPLKTYIQAALDRYVYREPYDYQRIVKDTTRTLTSTLDLASLLRYLCDVLNRTLRPDIVAVFTKDVTTHAFSLAASTSAIHTGIPHPVSRVASDAPLPAFLMEHRRPLLRDELGRTVKGDAAAEAVEHLSSLGGDFALPILSDRHFIGFLLIGHKLSGDAYFSEDVELASTLTQQAAIALENAQLYREVLLGNEYIQNILATMDSGVITLDATGHVALCNSTAEELLGLSTARLRSLDLTQLPESLAVHLRGTLTDGRARLQVETTLPSDDLRLLPIVCSTSALTDNRGNILGALVVFSDLSKIKALESEKRRAERLAAFGTLVSGIAHEIKNPLVAIKTFAELLPERFADTDFREDFAKVVVTEIDRIDDLVARLRGLAMPSAQSVGAIDIREPIDETLTLLRAKCDQTNTTVLRSFDDSEPYVSVESSQLKQLVLNLLINAIEAMGPGGRIMVRVTRRAGDEGSWIVTEISDTGPGIPDAIRSNIFNPFFTTKARGSGLGLAICRGITDAHRGTIRAIPNSTGTGTTMVVEFPAASVRASREKTSLLRA